MITPLADLALRAARAWVSFACRHARAVVAAAFLLTALAGVYLAANMRINTDTTDMLNPELPFRQLSRAVSEAFPQFSDNVLVVVEGDTPDLADRAALALAARLREKPELFGRVMDQAGDSFFRRNGLLYLSLEDLSDLSDRLARAQPFLGALWRDPTLRGLFAMLDLAAEEVAKNPADAAMEIGPTLEAIADVVEAQAEGRFQEMSWQEVMSGSVAEAKDKRRFLLIQPALDFSSLKPAGKAIADLRRLAEDMKLTADRGVRVRLTGSAALSQEEFAAVESSIGVSFLISLAAVAVIVFTGLRSLRMGGSVLLTLMMGLTWTGALGIALFGELNLLSVAFVVLFVGLSDDFGIHFCLRYVERLAAGEDRKQALAHGGADVGSALILCTATTAAGFSSFAPTDYRGLAQLGLIAGIGMFVALVTNMTVLPSLIEVFGTRASLAKKLANAGDTHHGAHASRGTVAFWRRLLHLNRPLTVALGAAAVAGAMITTQIYFDFDPLNIKDPHSESVRTLRALMDDAQEGRYSATILAKNLEDAEALAARLREVPEVDDTRLLTSFVPKLQDEKLAIVSEMALFLAPALTSAVRADRPGAAELRGDLVRLTARLDDLARRAESDSARAAARLAKAVRDHVLAWPADATTGARWRDLETRLLAALPGRLDVLKQALAAGPVALADLPGELRAQHVAADGRARLEVVPRDDLRDRATLLKFVRAVRAVAPDVTGSPVVLYESGQAILRSFAMASVLAFFAVVALLYIALRRVGDVLLTLVPAVLAATLTGAFSVLFDIPFNYANIIVLPLLFGMSVDYAIHLVLRGRETADLVEVLASSTPRAMIVSATTTITSFASLALTDHWGIASLGILLTVSMTMTLLASLVALPVVMAFVRDLNGRSLSRPPADR